MAMIALPEKVREELKASLRARQEKIDFERRMIERDEFKLSLNYAALLVVQGGEDGASRESILEDYARHYDCPDEDVFEELEEATRKGWIYPLYSNPTQDGQEYHVTLKTWRALGYDC
jgi:hypothetical protein